MERGFHLGHWHVWPQRDLIDGPGEEVHITPKSMAVLECLARAQGQVVSRNDVLDTVWPSADVTDDVLTHCLGELRKAFGDTAQHSRVIETIPKKGLRLLPEVAWFDEPESSAGVQSATMERRPMQYVLRYSVFAAAVIVVTAIVWPYLAGRGTPPYHERDATSIAVRRFVDLSENEDQQHLTMGLAEELVLRLSRIEGLNVVRPMPSAESTTDFVLDGSVRRSGDQLRVAVLLFDVRDSTQIWAHRFDSDLSDVFAIQDRIADGVAVALSAELGVGSEARIGSTSNLAAYELVLRGDSYFDLTQSGLDKALESYRNAVELDPDYALAWMRIAWYYGAIQYVTDLSEADDNQELAEKAIARALELAPESGYVLLSASDTHFMGRNWIEARRLYDRANAILDRRANTIFANAALMNAHVSMLLKLGYMSEQVRLLERASQGRRLRGLYAHFLPQAYLSVGRIDEALAEAEIAFPEPRARPNVSYVGLSVALTLDNPELIRRWSQRVLEHAVPKGRDGIRTMVDVLGDREGALAWLRETYETNPGLDDIVIVWAAYYGDDELVLKAMRRSLDLWFFWGPLMADARATEEFKKIVRDVGLVDYWRKYGWNDYCRPVGQTNFECS